MVLVAPPQPSNLVLVRLLLVDNQVFRNFFAYTLQDTGQLVYTMEASRELAKTVLEAVLAQLGESDPT